MAPHSVFLPSSTALSRFSFYVRFFIRSSYLHTTTGDFYSVPWTILGMVDFLITVCSRLFNRSYMNTVIKIPLTILIQFLLRGTLDAKLLQLDFFFSLPRFESSLQLRKMGFFNTHLEFINNLWGKFVILTLVSSTSPGIKSSRR